MAHPRRYHVYIMSNASRILYVGFTSDLPTRVHQHRGKLVPGFSSRYNVTWLVYFEEHSDAYTGITREKEIKGWIRTKKIELIRSMNPAWKDLSAEEGFFLPR